MNKKEFIEQLGIKKQNKKKKDFSRITTINEEIRNTKDVMTAEFHEIRENGTLVVWLDGVDSVKFTKSLDEQIDGICFKLE